MIMFVELTDRFPAVIEERARHSVRVFEVRYGSDNKWPDHTVSYFGIVPLSCVTRDAWAWFHPVDLRLTRKAFAYSKQGWDEIFGELNYRIYADCGSRVAQRFARFMGFEQINSNVFMRH